jgi:Predicted transcriptional regulator
MKKDTRQTSRAAGNQGKRTSKAGRGEGSVKGGKAPQKRGGKVSVPTRTYTVKDLSRILHYEPPTIYRLHRDGELPAPLPIGRNLRWDGNKFDEWVAAGCPRPKRRSK